MSQYEQKIEGGKLVYGWDPPLQSFFLQVHDDIIAETDPDANPVLILGATQSTYLPEVEDLALAVAKLRFDIPIGRRFELRMDQKSNT
jgi:hypothetical protein